MPAVVAAALRYALLFSGMSFRRHVNGLELCYRALVEQLGFAAENVHVLNYDGTLAAFGDPDAAPAHLWPGDGTAFRMVVRGAGSREAFLQAMAALATRLTPDDELFINTLGHGGHRGDDSGPDLLTYPYSERLSRDEFGSAIATLPPHRALVVLMAQCYSGGFNQAVLAASRATSTFITSAASETRPSFMDLDHGHWDSYQANWLAGLARGLTVAQAFQHACRCEARNPYDSPEFAAYPESATALTL